MAHAEGLVGDAAAAHVAIDIDRTAERRGRVDAVLRGVAELIVEVDARERRVREVPWVDVGARAEQRRADTVAARQAVGADVSATAAVLGITQDVDARSIAIRLTDRATVPTAARLIHGTRGLAVAAVFVRTRDVEAKAAASQHGILALNRARGSHAVRSAQRPRGSRISCVRADSTVREWVVVAGWQRAGVAGVADFGATAAVLGVFGQVDARGDSGALGSRRIAFRFARSAGAHLTCHALVTASAAVLGVGGDVRIRTRARVDDAPVYIGGSHVGFGDALRAARSDASRNHKRSNHKPRRELHASSILGFGLFGIVEQIAPAAVQTAPNNKLRTLSGGGAPLKSEECEGAKDDMPYDMDTAYSTSAMRAAFVGLETSQYAFTGGAHGSYGATCYVADLASGRLVRLAQELSGTALATLSTLTSAQLRKDNNTTKLTDAGFFTDTPELTADSNVCVRDEGGVLHLEVSFQPYEIGTWAMDTPTVAISAQDAKPLFSPGTMGATIYK